MLGAFFFSAVHVRDELRIFEELVEREQHRTIEGARRTARGAIFRFDVELADTGEIRLESDASRGAGAAAA